MTENSDTIFALSHENELNCCQIAGEIQMCSRKLGLILTKLGQFNARRMLIQNKVFALELDLVENFEELIERYRS